MFSALARLANNRPWRVLVVTVFGFLVAGLIGGPVAGLLNSDNDSFSDRNADSARSVQMIEKATGQSASPDILVLMKAGDDQAISATTQILRADEAVA